jgi:hypothetical protein
MMFLGRLFSQAPRRSRVPAAAAVALCLWGGGHAMAQTSQDVARWQSKLWFPIGEGIEYRAYWGVIPVASSMVTNELVEYKGKTCLAIRIRTRSNEFLSKIYPVDDFLESIIDIDTFLPLRFTKILREGRYSTHEVTEFDHAKRRAVWTRLKDQKRKELTINEDTRDLISFMYSMRPKDIFVPGREISFRVMADENLYDLKVLVDSTEKFRVAQYGWLESVKVQPIAEFGGLFVRYKGKAWMWISRDPRRLITKISVRIPVASVNIVLQSVYGPGDDFWVSEKTDAGPTDEPEEESDS